MDGAGSKSGALGSVSEEGLAPGASRMGTSCESIRGWLTGEEFVKVERAVSYTHLTLPTNREV